MNSRILRLIPATVAVLFACTSTAANETINLQSTELLEAFTESLDDAGLWYEVTGARALEVRSEDYDKAVQLLVKTAEGFLPGESFSFESKNCQEIFKAELEKAGIHYEVREHDGSEWVSWTEEDNGQVEQIKRDVSLRLCVQ